jgi:hypothetical protein
MKKITNYVKEFFFGRRAPALEPAKPGWKTTYHGGKTTYGDWCNEFRVSMLYGKTTTYMS